ncbi:MAG: JAB domain-containing protein [Kiritimatiellae bacterium]|nr:JAB domain-containing protein [Kiritimatiellia bacterium]MDD5519475.1 JAB domain-containing protein [Kiritimatiellia bacterium]
MYKIQTNMTVRKRAVVRDGHLIEVKTPATVAQECADIANASQEMMVVLTLNSKNNLINKQIVTLGLLDSALVHPREVFRNAIINNAAACILSHNHPSGNTSPSAEDIRITKQLIEAGKIVDIRLLDHVVIGTDDVTGETKHFSMRENGIVDFNG